MFDVTAVGPESEEAAVDDRIPSASSSISINLHPLQFKPK
jgi:hypothetical protein